MATICINLAGQQYSIHIEAGALSRLGDAMTRLGLQRQAFLAVDANVVSPHGQDAIASLAGATISACMTTIEATEANKSAAGLERLHRSMLEAHCDRQTPVVAIGGGIVGDLAGFAAATFMRGVPLVQVPTTLLAMVDASIGGKTAINFRDRDGNLVKNVVGAFWQPMAVIIDPLTLKTLPARDRRCGLAECVKHAVIADGNHLAFIEQQLEAIEALSPGVLEELITSSVSIKAAVVRDDPTEAGRRAILNLGHTFGHAIESLLNFDLKHGEAVSVGLCAAMHCSVVTGRMPAADADRVRSLLQRIGLPTRLSEPIAIESLIEGMRHDKKRRDGALRLVLPTGIGGVEIVGDAPLDLVREAWRAVGASR